MFGKNIKVKKQVPEKYDGKIKITEIFDTIQGEGIYSGVPAVFVRFSGCNLTCNFCDTDFDSGEYYTVPEILDEIELVQPKAVERKLVVITGGEPFLQFGLGELVDSLVADSYTVQIETAGTVFHNEFCEIFDVILEDFEFLQMPKALQIVCSPKTGSINKSLEPYITAYKYVLSADSVSDEDGLPNASYETGKTLKLFRPTDFAEFVENDLVWINPVDAYDEKQNKKNLEAAYQSCLKYGYRLGVQIHKLVGAP